MVLPVLTLLLATTAFAQPAPGWVPLPPPIACGAVEQPNNTFCVYLRNNCSNVISLHLGVHTIPGNAWAVPPAVSWTNDTWFSFPSLSLAPNASKGFGNFSVNVFYNATLETGVQHTFGFGCIFGSTEFDCSFNPGGKHSGFDADPYLSLTPPSLLGLLIFNKRKAAALDAKSELEDEPPAVALAQAAKSGLEDEPIVGVASQPLTGAGAAWTITAPTLAAPLTASVPGDLLTDLFPVIGDPLFGNAFDYYQGTAVVPPFWETGNVTYATTFDLAPSVQAALTADTLLVLPGVKLAAGVWLNGVYIGTTANQFVRWTFPVGALLKPAANSLRLEFVPATDTANAQARFMACSGGWDWAPYSGLTVGNGNPQSRVWTKGIWKAPYLVAPAPAALTAVKALVFYTGAYPRVPLTDTTASPFVVHVSVYWWAQQPFSGSLTVGGSWAGSENATVPVAHPGGGEGSATVALPAAGVSLWWPNGMIPGGADNLQRGALYTVTADLVAGSAAALSDARTVGFRVAHLVTANDTDPATLAGQNGSGNTTMRFKINGADAYVRGGNMIPMEELEGRRSAAAYEQLVASAAAANFNVMRVWGGGIYLDDAFFDATDRLGIMLYEDVMFSSDGRIPPVGNELEAAELRYQLRRLAGHPSIFLWSGCNECGGRGTYESFVTPTIAAEDPSRAVWPSCPSGGWASGVDMLTGLPNGETLVVAPNWAPPPTVSHAPCGDANCTMVAGADYDKGFVGEVFNNVPSAAACCELCANASAARCWAASYWEATCFFKPQNKTFTAGADVVSVFPPGRAPPPLPPPAPCEEPEFHGPYTHGFSAQFPMVNGQNDKVNVNLPPVLAPPLAPEQQGTAACGRFTSEFGASVFSSFESMAPTLPEKNWNFWGGEAPCDCPGSPWGRPCIGGNPMAQRNYPGDSFNVAFFGPSDFNTTGEAHFKKNLFLNMAAQALEKKGDIEVRRSQNHWGSITWQLNEIWPTGGWGSLEYGTVGFTPGQVLGGRWKPLHYLMAAHLYRDVIAVCGDSGVCYVRNDGALAPFSGSVTLSLARFSTSETLPLKVVPVALPRGAFALQYFCLGSGAPPTPAGAGCESVASVLSRTGCAAGDCALVLAVDDGDGAQVDLNFQLLAPPAQLALPPANVTVALGPPRPEDGAVRVDVTADAFALYVFMSTLAQGRFEENFFPMARGERSTWFIPFAEFNVTELAATIRVEHVGMYL